MRLFRRKFRLALCLVLGLPLVYLGAEHVRGRWMLSNWKNAMAAKGEKFSVNECQPKRVGGENSFPALARLANAGRGSLDALYPPTLKFAAPGRMISLRTLAEWPPASNNRTVDRGKTNVTWGELDFALRDWTNSFDEARALLELHAFDSRLDYHAGFAIPLPHLSPFKSLAQRLAAASANALHADRLEEALQHVETMLSLGRAMQNEPLIISQLVRQAVAQIAFGSTWQLLQHPGWTDEQLARLQHAWQLQEFIGPLGRSLEMERAIAVEMYVQMRGSASETVRLLGMWGGGPPTTQPVNSLTELADHLVDNFGSIFFKTVYVPIWQVAWSRQDELHYLETTQPFIAASRDAAENRNATAVQKAEADLVQSTKQTSPASYIRHLVSWRIAPGLERTLSKAINIEVQRELAVTALALRRYQHKHQHPAPDLAALVPQILPERPRDFWTGAPLLYQPLGTDGFLLYSVGQNGTADGGDAKPAERNNHSFSLGTGRDLTWPEAATVEEAISALEPKSKSRKPVVTPGPSVSTTTNSSPQ